MSERGSNDTGSSIRLLGDDRAWMKPCCPCHHIYRNLEADMKFDALRSKLVGWDHMQKWLSQLFMIRAIECAEKGKY